MCSVRLDHPAVSRVPLGWQVSVGGAEQRGSGRSRAPGATRRRQPRPPVQPQRATGQELPDKVGHRRRQIRSREEARTL